MNIVTGVYVPSEREKERRLNVHKQQLRKIANNKHDSFLMDLSNEKPTKPFPSRKISHLDSIATSNKIILNRINKITKAPLKPVVNYDYLSLKKLNSTLEGKI